AFFVGENYVEALRGVNTEIKQGDFVVVFGPSGSGKTTLLSLIAGLDKPTEGTVLVNGVDIYKLKPSDQARYRRSKIGMVFQQFNLIPNLNALDNISMPLLLSGVSKKIAYKRAKDLLEIVGLSNRINHKPSQMSGGEQQRIAIARAIMANPNILLVDEPTGNLDVPTGKEIFKLLQYINQKWHRTIVMITHNPDFLRDADHIVNVEDGAITKEDFPVRDSAKVADDNPCKSVAETTFKSDGHLSFLESFRLARIHFFSKMNRTLLTTLGVALGVGSILTLVSLGVGLQNITSNQLASIDALVTINVGINKNSQFSLDDDAVNRLRKQDNVRLISPSLSLPTKASYGETSTAVTTVAIDRAAQSFEGVIPNNGRQIESANEVVVSAALAKNLDVTNSSDLIGRDIVLNALVMPDKISDLSKIENLSLTKKIVGVTADDTLATAYINLNEIKTLVPSQQYSSIKVEVNDRKNVGAVRDQIEKIGYKTTSVVDLIERVDKIFLIAQIILGVIGGVALLVALIGIVNIMMMSLLERTHEVGVLKAIGATDRDVRKIFEYEVLLFGISGAALGVFGTYFFSITINTLINYLMRVSSIPGSLNIFVVPWQFALEMVALTIAVSLLAGVYPAKQAAKLSPMEALRYE
ncbi:MAG: ATP-binding cassette domain-containing protein, partial [Candidatus Berkelbacteria bacterium]